MAFKSMCRLFGLKMKKDTLVKFAFAEITILALLYFILIILRYATPYLGHDLFVELMLILGVGMAFDHYSMTTLLMKGCQ